MICRTYNYFLVGILLITSLTACIPQSGMLSISGEEGTKNQQSKPVRRGTHLTASTLISNSDSNLFGGTFFAPMGGGNLWDRLRTDFQLPTYEDRAPVQAQINWFVNHQGYLNRTIGRAAPYIYYIYEQVKQRNLPAELVLLPVIESAFNPFVSSSAGASGLWQLMPGTARGFGARQDWWFDGRRDIFASTNAALDYLTYLQSYFGGDWLLAIAAYNTGEGNVQRAIQRNISNDRNTSFWSLPLAMETRSYVPRLLAVAAIIRNPGKYGITLPVISDKPYMEQVDIGMQMDLAQAARFAGMSLAQLKALNPGYRGNVVDGSHKLILPIDRITLFKEQLASMPVMPIKRWGRYKVQRGDTLAKIATRFGITVSELREVNHLHTHATPIGKVIMIPAGNNNDDSVAYRETSVETSTTTKIETSTIVKTNAGVEKESATSTAEQSAEEEILPEKQSAHSQQHIIKKGETLNGIAKRYGVRVKDLQRWNNLKSSTPLKLGRKLFIEQPASIHTEKLGHAIHKSETSSTSVAEIKTIKTIEHSTKVNHYTVRAGDTLSSVARRFGVKSSDLKRWNHLQNDALKPGQKLVINA